LGPNGCGKTTLLRCLLGLVQPDDGRVHLGTGVKIGYFDQQLAELDHNAQAVDAIRPQRKEFNEQRRRDLLARFGLVGDTALQAVGNLSGGEQCRAALARLAAAEANLLVLDEPTNHLDLWARDALEESLICFEGTVLFVSHDRYFVNRVADHLLVVEEDRLWVIEGNYETYQHMMSRRPSASAEGTEKPESAIRGKGNAKADSPAKRKKRRFSYRKVADLEEDIFAGEAHLQDLHDQLAQGDTHRDGDRVRRIQAEIAQQKEAIAVLYEHWEEATELNW